MSASANNGKNNLKENVVSNSKRTRLIGLFLVMFSLFLGLSFLSYFFTWQDDQAIVLSNRWNLIFQNIKVKNITGRFGALLSHGLFYKSFGASCLILCTPIFAWGINKLLQKKIFALSKICFHSIVLSFYLSTIFGLLFSKILFPLAGAVGINIAEIILNSIGIVGAIFAALLVPLFYAVWIYNISLHLPKMPNIKFPIITFFNKLKNIYLIKKTTKNKENEDALIKTQIAEIEIPEIPQNDEMIDDKTNGFEIINNTHSLHEEVYEDKMPNKLVNNTFSGSTLRAQNSINTTTSKFEFEIIQSAAPIITQVLNVEKESVPLISPENLRNNIHQKYAMLEGKSVHEKYRDNVINVVGEVNDAKLSHNKFTLNPIKEEYLTLNLETNQLENLQNNQDKSSAIPLEVTPTVVNESVNVLLNGDAPALQLKTGVHHVKVVNILQSQNLENFSIKEDIQSINPFIDPTFTLPNFIMPSAKTSELLESYGNEHIVTDTQELEKNKDQIVATLKNYDIAIDKIRATVGPTVTLYEIIPAAGVRISKIRNLEDDIALSLAALGIRIIAPIPGKGTIGIEVPNTKKSIVTMKNLVQSEEFRNTKFALPIALGKTIDNKNYIVDLATMPHLLMAGATGQGKSVGINTILVSLLWKKHPSQLKFVMIDPKKVELSIYKTIEKHYLAKLPDEGDAIITDTKKVVHTINALCIEMDNRYNLLKDAGARNIKEYNEKILSNKLNAEQGHKYLPFIVLVIDEFADLIMTAGKEVEMPIARLAQLARAIGIHLIIATQRPSVNIITGIIKANFPVRIAFKVSSKIDSRTILDAGGADQLIGKGDMLISHNGDITRLQCAFVDTPEVERIVAFIGGQDGFKEAFLLPIYIDPKEQDNATADFETNDQDANFEEAARLIIQKQLASTSLIQRHLKLGYNRAGRIMDQLEQMGIVGAAQGSKPRELKVKTEMELNQILDRMI